LRNYELMAIHRPDLTDEDMRAKVADLQTFLTGKGATLNATDIWGKRRFAYEINHLREGYYSVLTFAADAPVVAELDRLLSLSDEVVRHKVFMVSAAGEGLPAPAE